MTLTELLIQNYCSIYCVTEIKENTSIPFKYYDAFVTVVSIWSKC